MVTKAQKLNEKWKSSETSEVANLTPIKKRKRGRPKQIKASPVTRKSIAATNLEEDMHKNKDSSQLQPCVIIANIDLNNVTDYLLHEEDMKVVEPSETPDTSTYLPAEDNCFLNVPAQDCPTINNSTINLYETTLASSISRVSPDRKTFVPSLGCVITFKSNYERTGKTGIIRVQPHGFQDMFSHKSYHMHFYHVAGQGTITIEKQDYPLEGGSNYLIKPKQHYQIKNCTNDELIVHFRRFKDFFNNI